MASKLIIFVIDNMAIFSGYITIMILVFLGKIKVQRQTRLAGSLFFLTCGLTHFEMANHALAEIGFTMDELLSWHMLLIHTLQAVAVIFFIQSLYVEFVKHGPDEPMLVQVQADS